MLSIYNGKKTEKKTEEKSESEEETEEKTEKKEKKAPAPVGTGEIWGNKCTEISEIRKSQKIHFWHNFTL